MPISSASAVGSGGTLPEQSASRIVATTAAGSHTLTIDGFSRSKSMRFKSGTFTVGGHTWCTELIRVGPLTGGGIIMLPRHCCTNCTVGKEVSVSASCSFSLLDQNGQPSYRKSAGDVCKFSEKMSTGVSLVVVDTKFLQSRAATYLPGDCLKVRCDLSVYMEPRCEDRELSSRLVAVPPPDMGQQLVRLVSGGVGADLAFEADGKTFAVHRHILRVRSPVLLEEIISGATSTTRTGGMEARVFKALLHYIYTDSLPEIEDSDMMDMVPQLIAASNRYSLDRLKLICEDVLCRRVDASRVAATLALAEEYNCHGLKKACFQFLMSGSNLKAAMAAGGFEHLRSSCPSVLQEVLAVVGRR